ncbi:MAG: hypothetical protein EOP84_14200 [Verrucomicrobiaceae bacterium]|nr:MAG: hypothetical protein EOP84_14200 [Verrucomicrobiaceae bacterium]
MPNLNQELSSAFKSSLKRWGGIVGKCVGDSSNLITPLKGNLADKDYPPPNYREKPDKWSELVPVIGAFTNAFLIQELDRISDGPGSLIRALDVL